MQYLHGYMWVKRNTLEHHWLKRCGGCKRLLWNHRWIRLSYLYGIINGPVGIPGPSEKTAYACCERCATAFQPLI